MAPSGTCSKAATRWTEQYNKVRRIHTEYRALPHGGEKISVIGMGSSVIGAQPEKEITATVRAAVDSGVNYFDMAGGPAAIFAAYGKALEGIRDKVYLQIHFGADYTSGEYGWTTELAEVKRSVAWQLE